MAALCSSDAAAISSADEANDSVLAASSSSRRAISLTSVSDSAAAPFSGFRARHGLETEYRVNIEANHATLAGHSFHHEVAQAVALGIFGSIDANRGDYQNGWDTDQFPNSVDELSLAIYEILRGGGFTTGGFNFDAKLRRQSLDRTDLVHAHIGGMDTLARALLVAAAMVERGTLDQLRAERYAGWDTELGRSIVSGDALLEVLAGRVAAGELDPRPVSGHQELFENLVNREIWAVDTAERATEG